LISPRLFNNRCTDYETMMRVWGALKEAGYTDGVYAESVIEGQFALSMFVCRICLILAIDPQGQSRCFAYLNTPRNLADDAPTDIQVLLDVESHAAMVERIKSFTIDAMIDEAQ
jgi:hypothetical protein